MAKGSTNVVEVEEYGHLTTKFTEVLKTLSLAQVNFALWYFDPDREGTQEEWAVKNSIHRQTLSIWKAKPWFLELSDCWAEMYGARFSEVVRTLYKRATNEKDWHGVQAARTLAELLGKFPSKEVKHVFSISEYLKGEVKDIRAGSVLDDKSTEDKPNAFKALPDGRSLSEIAKEEFVGQRPEDNEQEQ